MIFDQLRLSLDQQDRSPLRKEMAHGLINIFQATFPSVRFGILDKITAINAQASVLNGVRAVHLFGGFAYHPLIGRDSLIFALLHETGHHLANGRRLSWLPDIACECAADVWGVLRAVAF